MKQTQTKDTEQQQLMAQLRKAYHEDRAVLPAQDRDRLLSDYAQRSASQAVAPMGWLRKGPQALFASTIAALGVVLLLQSNQVTAPGDAASGTQAQGTGVTSGTPSAGLQRPTVSLSRMAQAGRFTDLSKVSGRITGLNRSRPAMRHISELNPSGLAPQNRLRSNR